MLWCRVYIIHKVRAKTEIHLGISGEKIEIDPVITGKGAGRFWNRQKAVSYHMDNIAWCELTESKGSKTTFTLVYTAQQSTMDSIVCKYIKFINFLSFISQTELFIFIKRVALLIFISILGTLAFPTSIGLIQESRFRDRLRNGRRNCS